MDLKKKLISASSDSRWAWLPKNIVDSILDRLGSLAEYIRFTAVCKAWQSVALDDQNRRLIIGGKHRLRQLPLPMIPGFPSSNVNQVSFYAVLKANQKVLNFHVPVPHISKRFIGSSLGWLIYVNEDHTISLMNPVLGPNSTITFPPILRQIGEGLDDFDEFYSTYRNPKAVLSADPALNPDDFVLAAMYNSCGDVAFIKPGCTRWVKSCPSDDDDFLESEFVHLQGIVDIIYCNGFFYVLQDSGAVSCIELKFDGGHGGMVKKATCNTPEQNLTGESKLLLWSYIVQSCSGDLKFHMK